MFSKTFFDRVNKHPEHLVNARKLDIAMRKSVIHSTIENIRSGEYNINSKILLLNKEDYEITSASQEPNILSYIMAQIFSDVSMHKYYVERKKDKCTDIFKIIKYNMTFQHNYNQEFNQLREKMASDVKFEDWLTYNIKPDNLISNLLHLEQELGLLVERSGSLQHLLRNRKNRMNLDQIKNKCRHHIPSLKIDVVWNKQVCMIDFQDNHVIAPVEYILQMHNKVCDLISSLLIIKFNEMVCFQKGSYELTIMLIKELCRLSMMYGNDYYGIVKCFEGIIIGEIIAKEEAWINKELINSIADELTNVGFYYKGSELESIIQETSSPLKNEFGGFAKIFGHPYIDMEKSMAKFTRKATTEKSINPLAVQHTVLLAKEGFIKNYILKHKKWPDVIISQEAPLALREAHRSNVDPSSISIVKRFGSIEFTDYVYVELKEMFKLNKLNNYVEYLKDKSISLLKNKVVNKYFSDMNTQDSSYRWEDTRLLLVYLLNSHDALGTEEYLEDYLRTSDDLEDCLNHLVIKLVPKEKELKKEGRMFGCKTYTDRYRGKVQEENAGWFMDQYVIDQSMTIDHLGLINRLKTFRNMGKIYKGWRSLTINFDVSGWNSNFRDQTVAPIMEETLDKLYGTNLFSKTQKSYENTFFYTPDADGHYSWQGQYGGVDGLNQYTWMIVYIPQMQLALNKFKLRYFVMAYGDDYKAQILIPPNVPISQIPLIKDTIVNTVVDTAITNFGQEMKYFDSYGSECFLSFCKNASIHEVELSQGIRKIQKCYGSNNAFLPTLDDYIASSFSNGHSAGNAMPCYYATYCVSLFWSIYYLMIHYNIPDNISYEEIIAHLLIPSVLGGFPIIHLHNFATRTEADHLPVFVDMCNYAMKHYPLLFKYLVRAFRFDVDKGELSDGILRDPYSLPLRKPQLPDSILRKEILPALLPYIKAEDFKELVDAVDLEWEKKIIKCLLSSNPLQPRLASSVFSSLPTSLIAEFSKRFENAHSVKILLVKKKGIKFTNKLLRKVMQSELELISWRINRIRSDETLMDDHWIPHQCPKLLADKLRELWGKKVTGVTMPPIKHLIKFKNSDEPLPSDHDIKNHFTYTYSEPKKQVACETSDHWKIGEFEPFVGYKTRLGSTPSNVKLIENNALLLKMQTLLDVISWSYQTKIINGVEVSSNLHELIMYILSQFFPGDVEKIIPLGAIRKGGGTITHHWRSPHYKEHIIPNTLSNIYTSWKGEVNTHSVFRASDSHYTINFLQILCHSINILSSPLQYSEKLNYIDKTKFWVVTTDCQYCMTPISEDPIVLDLNLINMGDKKRILKYTNIDSLSLNILYQSLDEHASQGIKQDIGMGDLPPRIATLGVITEFLQVTNKRMESLQDRFSTGPVSTEALSRISALGSVPSDSVYIRETEIRHMNPDILVYCLSVFIYNKLLYGKLATKIGSIETYITTEDPRMFPWVRLLELIHKAGMLGQLIRAYFLISNLPYPACFDNPLSAGRYVAQASIAISETMTVNPQEVFISNREEVDYTHQINRYVLRAKLSIIHSKLFQFLKTTRVQLQNSEMLDPDSRLYQIITALCCVCYAELEDVEDISDEINNSTNNSSYETELFVITFPHYEIYSIWESEEYIMFKRNIKKLNAIYNLNIKMKDINYDTMRTQERQALELIGVDAIHVNMEVWKCDLPSCITIIRKEQNYAMFINQDKDVNIPQVGVRFYEREKITYPRLESNLSGFHMPEEQIDEVSMDVENIFLCEEIVLSPHYLWRPFSNGTSSMNKFIELETIIGSQLEDLTGVSIACLGEGYGGLLNYIATITKTNHFLYNSIPASDSSLCQPELAMEALQQNNHSLSNELMKSGIYDLSKTQTLQLLVGQDTFMYSLVTNDTEMQFESYTNYCSIILNVTKFWIIKRSPGSLFLCKIMAESSGLISKICSFLSHYSHTVHLYQLHSSPVGGELYIVAYGNSGTPVIPEEVMNYTLPKINVSRMIYIRSQGLLQNLRNQLNSLHPHKNMSILFNVVPCITRYRKYKAYFRPQAFQIMTGKLSIGISFDSVINVDGSILIEKLKSDLDRISMIVQKDISNQGKQSHVKWNDMTHAKSLRLAEKYIYLESLKYYLRRVYLDNMTRLTQSEHRNAFLTICKNLDPRTGMQLVDLNVFNKEFIVHNQKSFGFYFWTEGLYTIQSLFIWNNI